MPIVSAWQVWEKRALTSVLRCLHWIHRSRFSRIRHARECLVSGSDHLRKRSSMPKVQASISSVRGASSTKSGASPLAVKEPTGVRLQPRSFHLRPVRQHDSTHRLQPVVHGAVSCRLFHHTAKLTFHVQSHTSCHSHYRLPCSTLTMC